MTLPPNTRLLVAHDGGPRSPDYYCWVFFATNRITMPPTISGTDRIYLTNDSDTGIRIIEGNLKTSIKKPLVTISSDWDTDTNEFRGIIVSTPEGDYFHVQRFSNFETRGAPTNQ